VSVCGLTTLIDCAADCATCCLFCCYVDYQRWWYYFIYIDYLEELCCCFWYLSIMLRVLVLRRLLPVMILLYLYRRLGGTVLLLVLSVNFFLCYALACIGRKWSDRQLYCIVLTETGVCLTSLDNGNLNNNQQSKKKLLERRGKLVKRLKNLHWVNLKRKKSLFF
jgi:hypothetical protein